MRNDPQSAELQKPPNEFGTIEWDNPKDFETAFTRCFKPERSVMRLLETATCFARITIGESTDEGHKLVKIEEKKMNELLYGGTSPWPGGPVKNFATYVGNMIFIFSQSIQDNKAQFFPLLMMLAGKYVVDTTRTDLGFTKDQFEDHKLGFDIWEEKLVELCNDAEWSRLQDGR